MKIYEFNVSAPIGSFIKPHSNNNPTTFQIIPKSALVGIILANIGVERKDAEKLDLYGNLTKNIKYSVCHNNPLKIKFWSEYAFNLYNFKSNNKNKNNSTYTPSKYERLYNIDYQIYLLFDDKNNDLYTILKQFKGNVEENVSTYPMYMGMANMPLKMTFVNEYSNFETINGVFKTKGVVSDLLMDMNKQPFDHIREDKIPIESKFLQHIKYKTIYFNDSCGEIWGNGNHIKLNDQTCLEFV